MHVQVPERDHSSTFLILLRRRRQSRVCKNAFRRGEDVVEKIILQVPPGERLGLLVFYRERFSAGERRAASERGKVLKEIKKNCEKKQV